MSSPEVKKCNVCGSTYDRTLSYCLNDGTPLVVADALLGATLDGRYRIDSLLGRGGMGVVYRATHVHIDTEFAIKVLHPDLVANQSAIERFRREARAAGRIHHPNAIQVTDFGVTKEGIVYLVMELVDGLSLREVIVQEKTLEYRRAVSIMHQVCAAVEAAHQSGVIHRDLKPDNIVIKRVGNIEKVKVLDFGIAKLKEQTLSAQSGQALTKEGMVIGTPEYMSPEQCRARNLDARSDIYSLGTILYEMLSGFPPFTGDSPLEVVAKHLKEMTRPLRQVCPIVPEPIEQAVMRALEKDPEKRPSSATRFSYELMEAVKAVKSGYTTKLADSQSGIEILLGEETPDQEDTSLTEDQTQLSTIVAQPTDARKTVVATPSGVRGRVASDNDRRSQLPEAGNLESKGMQEAGGYSTPASPQSLSETEVAKKLARPRMLIIGITVILVAAIGVIVHLALKTSSPSISSTSLPSFAPPPAGMVFIRGGEFTMGWNGGEEDEKEHKVTVKSFYIDQYEVTNQQYKEFVVATGHQFPRHWVNGSYKPGDAKLPITYVTWKDAVDYATWARKRLPTEEEWEYAARGGSKGYLYPWGDKSIEGYANVARREGQAELLAPVDSDSFKNDKSPFDVYGMAGNVSEWVDGSAVKYLNGRPLDEKCPNCKICRGGNIRLVDEKSTTTHRSYDHPEFPSNDTLSATGFRCAKDAKEIK